MKNLIRHLSLILYLAASFVSINAIMECSTELMPIYKGVHEEVIGNQVSQVERNTMLQDEQKPRPSSCVIWNKKRLYGFESFSLIVFYRNFSKIAGYLYDEKNHEICLPIGEDGYMRYFFNEGNPRSIDSSFPLDLRNVQGCIKESEQLQDDLSEGCAIL